MASEDKSKKAKPAAGKAAKGAAVAKPKTKKPAAEKSAAAPKVKGVKGERGEAYVPTLLGRYRKDVVSALQKEFSYKNANQVPTVTKVVLNFGVGAEAVVDPNVIKQVISELTDLSGQRAVATKAKKAIANFKLRAGQPIGCMVTLRKQRMWDFLLRFINLALPRTRDFKGVSPKLDGRGNYTMGIKEQNIFSELPYEKTPKIRGMNITITTSATSDAEGMALLKHLGMPFRLDAARS